MSGCKTGARRVYVVDFTAGFMDGFIAKKSSQEDIWSTMIMDLPCLWFDEHIPVVSFQGGCFVVFPVFRRLNRPSTCLCALNAMG